MLKKLAGRVRRCIDDYDMIGEGETVAVGVSGGKDSIALLRVLAEICRYHPKGFRVHAVTLDMGIEGMDFGPVGALCDELGVEFTLRHSPIAKVVFEDRMEKNPCSLCAKMRRAALGDMITGLGIKKIALAHHYDDAIETFLLSLLYEGRLHCFQPVTYLDRSDVTQIRPMLYVEEKAIIRFVEAEGLKIVHNPCAMNGVSKREEVKRLIGSLQIDYKDVKSKVFGAMQRLPMEGWELD